MQSLALAFVLALAGVVTTYFALKAVGVDKSIAVSVATVIVGGIPYIREEIEKRAQVAKGIPPSRIIPLAGYGIPPRRLLVYASLLMFAAIQLAGAFGGLTAAIFGTSESLELISLVGVLTAAPAVFLVGRWIGQRAFTRGALTTVVAAFSTRLISAAFDSLLLSHADFEKLMGEEKSVAFFATQVAVGGVAISAAALLGYWRGARHRLSSYLRYLLSNVPEASRNAIVELAFEEANQTTNLQARSVRRVAP